MLYKPWRRRVDKKRLGSAHFEQLTQGPDAATPSDEERRSGTMDRNAGTKGADIEVQSFETAALAGPARH